MDIDEIDVATATVYDTWICKDLPTGINACLEWAHKNKSFVEEALDFSTLYIILNGDPFGFLTLSEGSPVINQYSNRATWLKRAGALECWK